MTTTADTASTRPTFASITVTVDHLLAVDPFERLHLIRRESRRLNTLPAPIARVRDATIYALRGDPTNPAYTEQQLADLADVSRGKVWQILRRHRDRGEAA